MTANTATPARKTRAPRVACGGDLCKNKARVGHTLCGKCAALYPAQDGPLATVTDLFASDDADAVQALEEEGMTTGDAQAALEAEALLADRAADSAAALARCLGAVSVTHVEERVEGGEVVEVVRATYTAATKARTVTVKVEGRPVRMAYTRPAEDVSWAGRGTWVLEGSGRTLAVDAGAWTLDGAPLDLRKSARLIDAVRLAL